MRADKPQRQRGGREERVAGPARNPAHKQKGRDVMSSIVAAAADPGMQSIIRILDGIRNALVLVLAALAIAALTYAGVRYVIAGGDPAGVEKAKGAAKSALIGLALALVAPIIVAIVKSIVSV